MNLKAKCGILLGTLMLLTGLWAGAQNQVRITGKVLDQNGQPVIGSSVKQAGTTNGVVTGSDGSYTLTVPVGATIEAESLGFEMKSAVVTAGKTTYDFSLSEESLELDDVVVVGYGTQRKKLVTGSTINVTSDQLERQSMTQVTGALYSSVPGVNIVQSSGQPWSEYTITVRGLNTTGSGRSPLIVIDGVAGGDLRSLNPDDVESIDILKDAASSAIYGARASAGVVLVTTKQGQKGRVSVTYNGYIGIQQAKTNGVHPVSASEYLDLVDRSFVDNGTLQPGEHYYNLDLLMPVQKEWMEKGLWNGTDWLKQGINKNAPTTNHSVNINGGNDVIRYALGISKSYTEGTLGAPKHTFFDRTTVRLNTEVSLWRKNGRDILRFGENATLTLTQSNGASVGGRGNTVGQMLYYTPLLPAYELDGKTLYTYESQTRDEWSIADGAYNLSERALLEQTENRSYRLQGNAYLTFTPHQDWTIKSTVGFRWNSSFGRTWTPKYRVSGSSFQDYDNVDQSGSMSSGWTWENTVNWKHTFGDHSIEALVGQSIEATGLGLSLGGSRKQTRMESWEAANLSSSDSEINSGMVSISGGNTVPYTELFSFFTRANYSYRDKYLLTLILRADGSSNFARGHRFGYYPSVSAGWIATEESFMSGVKSWMPYFKLRASWGQNGNANISAFQYSANVSLAGVYDFTPDGSSISTGAYPSIVPNPDLKWETTEQTDIGFDAKFIRNRLGVTFDWYRKDTKDWLIRAPVLGTYGTGAPMINGGSVRNSGVELALTWNHRVGDLNYNLSVNGSYNKNKVLSINNSEGIIHGSTNVLAQNQSAYNLQEARVGKPLGYFTGIASKGIFQSQAQIDEYNRNGYAFIDGYEKAQPGDVIWIDQNGDGLYDKEDVVEIGNPHPDFNLGFSMSFNYKGFDLSISGSGAFGQQVVQSYRSFSDTPTHNYTSNFVKRLWTGEGSTNSFPRFGNGNSNNFLCKQFVGDIWCFDADYVKIRNITIGYDFKRIIKKLPVNSLRLYFTGQNLITITGYDGMDPEVGYGGGVSWSSGVDVGYYPAPKVYMAGISIKF
ncbi:MAG: TonB-dependent receptor [Bacteroidales bacterium]|nr:TonB-dependent receptor [Bacteroidales bacterium]